MFNIKKLVVLLLCAGLVFQAHFGIAGPQGGKVVGGNANISQSGPNTTINQTSDRAIINWNSFDIGKNESVHHNMPSSNSAGLHRVVGKGGPSQIEGLLQSNGNIYLVNPAGVVIHNGAKIDVNGFVATSRDIANDNFMKGKMVFDKPGLSGAAIINQGNISLRDNGLAALVAPTVRNDGIIAGKLGKVTLGGSDAAWKLDMTGDDLIAFTMDEKQVNTLYAADGTPLASVQNNGKIKAEGGVVVLTASQLDGIVGSVVNNGEISAASAETKGGKIIFRGKGNRVDVVNNGQLDVSSKAAEGGNVRMNGQSAVTHAGQIDVTGKTKGGNAVITGENVTLKSCSRIDASGTNGGGTVLIGGNARGKGPEINAKTTLVQSDAEILADAKLFGDGGQIVVWADEKTKFDGKATAKGGENGGDGGMVETSTKLLIIGDPAVVNTSAKKGNAGEWLLDPEDFVIAAAGGNMTGEELSTSLQNNSVNIICNVGRSRDNGNIFIHDSIYWSSNSSLVLNATHDVNIYADITAAGNESSLIINPHDGSFNLINGKINLPGNNARLNIKEHNYTIINSIHELQEISHNLGGYFALGSDIDASPTINWNNGKGFEPIGKTSTSDYKAMPFNGIFNGLGHKVSNLYINRTDETGIGIFGHTCDGAKILNTGLENAVISGRLYVGALVGLNGDTGFTQGVTKNYAIIDNSWSSGNVSGGSDVGGLVGANCGKISNSSSYASVKTEGYGGGLVGDNSGAINSSFSSGNVEGGSLVGGFAGSNFAPFHIAIISDSYSIGDVFGSQYIGGFVGYIAFSDAYINNSYSTGKVSGKNAGGFAGISYGSCKIIDSYWDMDASCQTTGLGGIKQLEQAGDGSINWSLKGLTTEQMVTQTVYKGWNFNDIWRIVEEKNYPQLINVAVNNTGQSSTENVYHQPIIPGHPTNPGTPNQPSDPGGDPSQPSTKPDTNPDKDPGSNGSDNIITTEGISVGGDLQAILKDTKTYVWLDKNNINNKTTINDIQNYFSRSELDTFGHIIENDLDYNMNLGKHINNKSQGSLLAVVGTGIGYEIVSEILKFVDAVKSGSVVGTIWGPISGVSAVPDDIKYSEGYIFTLSRALLANSFVYLSNTYYTKANDLLKTMRDDRSYNDRSSMQAVYDVLFPALVFQKMALKVIDNPEVGALVSDSSKNYVYKKSLGDLASFVASKVAGNQYEKHVGPSMAEGLVKEGFSKEGAQFVSKQVPDAALAATEDGIGTLKNAAGKTKWNGDSAYDYIMNGIANSAINEAYSELEPLALQMGMNMNINNSVIASNLDVVQSGFVSKFNETFPK